MLLVVLFLVYLFATLTFAKSRILFDFGPKDDADSNLIKVRVKDQGNVKEWIKRTDQFLEGECQRP